MSADRTGPARSVGSANRAATGRPAGPDAGAGREPGSAPAADAVAGPAFPRAVRLAVTAVAAALALAAGRALPAVPAWSAADAAFGLAMAAIVGWGCAVVLGARTRCDAGAVEHTAPGRKPRRVALADVTQAAVFAVPGLAWLIAPRLVVRTATGAVTTFPTGDAAVLARFRHLARGG